MKFYIVDAFTETLFGGNPAGVVILPDGTRDFPSGSRQPPNSGILKQPS